MRYNEKGVVALASDSLPDLLMNYARLYDRMAPCYAPAWRLIRPWWRYSAAALAWLPADARARVLEIGPGPGLLLERLAQRHDFVVGLDLSAGMLARARARLSARGLPPRLVRGDAAALPFASASFDAILMTFVFSAIPDGREAMRGFARALRPGGMLILVDACIPADGNLPARFLARIWSLFGDRMRDEAALMRAAGLEVITVREFGAFRSIRLTVGRKLAPGRTDDAVRG